ncbi:MAG: hypothetical protein SFX18_13900 [Pirellulales bacterium]|nr:hypothetical protein [Pirellulales bacterium]
MKIQRHALPAALLLTVACGCHHRWGGGSGQYGTLTAPPAYSTPPQYAVAQPTVITQPVAAQPTPQPTIVQPRVVQATPAPQPVTVVQPSVVQSTNNSVQSTINTGQPTNSTVQPTSYYVSENVCCPPCPCVCP